MAEYATLKATIDAYIKQNGVKAITGPILNAVLTAMVGSLGRGYQFMGWATTHGNPGTPDQNVFYIATLPGTYANYGGETVADGEIYFFLWDGEWTSFIVATVPKKVSQLTNDSGYITKAVSDLVNYYTKTQMDTALAGKQQTLISGMTIKTINGESLLGSGDIEIQGGDTSSCVKVTEQSFTDAQKAQARTNIGASDFSGDYDDLTNKPTIPAAQIQSDWNQVDSTAKDFIKNKPSIPTDVVQYVSQTLTDSQQRQARNNIRAIGRGIQVGYEGGDYVSVKIGGDCSLLFGLDIDDIRCSLLVTVGYLSTGINIDAVVLGGTTSYHLDTNDNAAYVYKSGNDYYVVLHMGEDSGSVMVTAVSGTEPTIVNAWVSAPGSLISTNTIRTIPAAQVNADWDAVSGVAQILNKPTIPAAQVNSDWNAMSGVAEILNKPTIPTVPTISTDVESDKASTSKTSCPKSVYDFVRPAVQSSQPAGGMLPNVLYTLGTLTGSVTIALASPADANVVNHYFFTFESGSTAPTITWPAAITGWVGGAAPTINASKHYEVSILNGIAAYLEV